MNGLAGAWKGAEELGVPKITLITGTIETRFLCTSWWLAIEFTFEFDVNETGMTVNDLLMFPSLTFVNLTEKHLKLFGKRSGNTYGRCV